MYMYICISTYIRVPVFCGLGFRPCAGSGPLGLKGPRNGPRSKDHRCCRQGHRQVAHVTDTGSQSGRNLTNFGSFRPILGLPGSPVLFKHADVP